MIDLIGKHIGCHLVLERLASNKFGESQWLTKCTVCGTESIRRNAKTCHRCQKCASNQQQDLVGKHIGQHLVLELRGRSKNGKLLWLTKCTVCGKETLRANDVNSHCCKKCAAARMRIKVERTCPQCGEVFILGILFVIWKPSP